MPRFSPNCLVDLSFHPETQTTVLEISKDVTRSGVSNPPAASDTGNNSSSNNITFAEKTVPVHQHHAPKAEKFSCSATIIDSSHGLILSHGCLLTPLLTSNSTKYRIQRSTTEANFVLFDDEPKADVGEYTLQVLLNELAPSQKDGNDAKNLKRFPARPVIAWDCPSLINVLHTFFPSSDGWRFVDDAHSVSMTTDERKDYLNYDEQSIQPIPSKSETALTANDLMTWFVLLKIECWENCRTDPVKILPSSRLIQGQSLITIATPFASICPMVFFNSQSSGIVSNVAGNNNTLIMTDARCLPGTEGGAVYTKISSTEVEHRYLTGLIVAPLCWKSNEWIGLTLVCSISEILHVLNQILKTTRLKRFLQNIDTSEIFYKCITHSKQSYGFGVSEAIKRVVLVQAGSVWGSGILVGNDTILTCRHVISGARNGIVQVRFDYPSMHWVRADVIFTTSDLSAFDIAVLRMQKIHKSRLSDLKIATQCTKGSDICVVGHALFPRELSKQPSVTYGILSNIVIVKDKPVLLQSTCAVHSGASGGPLLSAKTGELIGIVASNSKDTVSGASFPHINFSIPMAMVQETFANFLRTGDVKLLDSWNIHDSRIQKIWKLQDSLSSYKHADFLNSRL
uniref:Peroxisomal leader peptide-processing protease n=1 Tax=Saccoglossus kowalevskii TaxID=10224 RepID=A0ABM0LX02_SACKO|nr:PREDICTED: peroxisomal leader peptide-processing protease-like [Saccoglossus kowalevskii]